MPQQEIAPNSPEAIRTPWDPLPVEPGATDPLPKRSLVLWPLLVLLFSLTVTGFFWRNAQQEAVREAQSGFERQVSQITRRVEALLSTQELLLRGMAGLFNASGQVTREDFSRYFDTMHIDEQDFEFGIMAYHEIVPAEKLARHLTKLRQEGFPEYRISPDGERDVYAPLVYIEPFTGANRDVLGFDPLTVAAERKAVGRARDSDLMTISSRLTLRQDAGKDIPGFVMYVPIYLQGLPHASPAERQANFAGWVDAPVRMPLLITHALEGGAKNINLEIFDSATMSQASLLYQYAGAPRFEGRLDAPFKAYRQLEFGGQTWSLGFHSLPGFDPGAAGERPIFIAVTGALLSFILSVVTALVILSQRRRVKEALSSAAAMAAKARDEQRQQAEIALRDSEYTARLAVENTRFALEKLKLQKYALDQHAIVATTNARGEITYANDKFCEISGYSVDELMGKHHHLLNSGVNPEGFFKKMNQTIYRGEVWHSEVCSRAKDGHLYWEETTVVPFMDATGKPEQYIAICTDITENKAAQLELMRHRDHLEELVEERTAEVLQAVEALRTSEEKYRILVEESSDPIFTFNPDGQYRYVNRAFANNLGKTTEEIIGRKIRDVFPQEEADKRIALLSWVFENAESRTIEVSVPRADGERHFVTTAKPIINDQFQVISVICISKDITERKRAEEAAHASNRAKSEFLANMSHEIRTPMNGVVGMVDILQQTPLSAEQQRMLGTIHDSSLALLNILNDILDYSKIEAGKLAIESIPTHLREVAEGVVQLMVTMPNFKSIDLNVFVSPELPRWITSDPTRLRQVLLNLLGNALKFTSSHEDRTGRVVLRVEPCSLADGQPGLRMRIIDSGIGMRPEEMARLFQPFTQADASTARKFGGTGLGLSITQRLVEMMGGRIAVHSTFGEGAEFTVELPLQESQPGRALPADLSLDGVHVLAVSSDAMLKEIVPAYCRAAGAEVTLVADLAGAHQRLQRSRHSSGPTVVLLGIPEITAASELDLPADTSVVRCVRRNSNFAINEVMVFACPLLYQDLIQAVALASGGLTVPEIASQAERRRSPPRATAPGVEEALCSGRLILLAEDNETNREVMQEQLRLLGYTAEVAADGVLALEMWRRNRYALLLTDCHMPNMDGFELTAAIRAAEGEGTAHLPIVAVTANAMQGEAQRCLERGMDDYLAKPLRLNELGPMLAKWLPLPELLKDEGDDVAAELLASNQAGDDSGSMLVKGDNPVKIGDPSPPSLPAIWVPETLIRLVGDDPARNRRLLETFLHNAQKDVAAICVAAEAGETGKVADAAHKLKSSSLMAGALLLGKLCQEIETAGRQADGPACRTHAERIKEVFAETSEKMAIRTTGLDQAISSLNPAGCAIKT